LLAIFTSKSRASSLPTFCIETAHAGRSAKLSWGETAQAMAAAREDWSDLTAALRGLLAEAYSQ
jgi:hypothetical protein